MWQDTAKNGGKSWWETIRTGGKRWCITDELRVNTDLMHWSCNVFLNHTDCNLSNMATPKGLVGLLHTCRTLLASSAPTCQPIRRRRRSIDLPDTTTLTRAYLASSCPIGSCRRHHGRGHIIFGNPETRVLLRKYIFF
jgi:hypothetical protein